MLDPPRGVAPLRIGMTLDGALAAVAGWTVLFTARTVARYGAPSRTRRRRES
ncbi:hypothetical protein [Streptomyces sp. NPDC002644]